MTDQSTDLLVDRAGAVLTLTINRPAVFNALDARLLQRLRDEVARADADPGIRAVIVTGAGPKAFSAGADLKELQVMGPDRAAEVMRNGQQVMREIERATVPVIAAVNGLALGGGFELVLAATFPVLSTTASLGLPESGLGLIPGYGGTQRLPRIVGRTVAAHLMLTGARLDAERAYALGLTPVAPVAADRLMDAASALATTVAQQGPQAVRSILTALDRGSDVSIDAGLTIETGLAALAIAGAESDEGIAAFLERRPARFGDPEGAS